LAGELERLAEQIRGCRKCPLWKSRRNAVPGEGAESASCMFIGESPGEEEDRTGRPFVGRSGKFLDQALEDAGLNRGDFFITGSVKCHPPDNRDPRKSELDACRPYLERQIEVIQPKVILLLGRVAVNGFLGNSRLSDIRGRAIDRDGLLMLPTYHPAAAMRFPSRRAPFLEDMETLSSLLSEINGSWEESKRRTDP